MNHDLDAVPNLPAGFFALAASHPHEIAYSQPALLSRKKRETTFAEAARRVAAVARHLSALGLAKGDRVAIISNTRPEWLETEMGILAAGGICVSIYPSIPWQDVGYILYDSGARIVFAENQEQIDKLEVLAESDLAIPATESRGAGDVRVGLGTIIAFESVRSKLAVQLLDEIITHSERGSDVSVPEMAREDVATFVYTSGTTGPPKGVVQTHGNHLSNVRQVCNAGLFDDVRGIMLFLPLAHSYAKLLALVGLLRGITLKFPAVSSPLHSRTDPVRLGEDIASADACVIPTVPRLLEKIQASVVSRASQSGLRAALLRLTIRSARARSKSPPREGFRLADALVHSLTAPIRSGLKRRIFGRRFRYAISAGAKLAADTHAFFDALGIEVVEGYGLTETCVATNVGRPGGKKIGSVGPVLADDIEIKLGSDGEILYRGPNVALGYYNRPEATARAWDSDGWFHTGDIGMLDGDGHLRLIGRKKEIIVTAGGKKIAPDKIEERLKSSGLISQAVVIGEGRPYCVGLLTLNYSVVKSWIAASRLDRADHGVIMKKLIEQVEREVAKVNSGLASFESIKRVRVLPIELTVENQMLTPTFKLRRAVINERFADEIESLYQPGASRVNMTAPLDGPAQFSKAI